MPLKSEAQRRFLHAAEARGEVPRGLAHKFEHATSAAKKARLPMHVKKAERYEGVDSEGQMATNKNESIEPAAGSAMMGVGKGAKKAPKGEVKMASFLNKTAGRADGMFFGAQAPAEDGQFMKVGNMMMGGGMAPPPNPAAAAMPGMGTMGHGKPAAIAKSMLPKPPAPAMKVAEPNTQVDGADRTGRDYTAGPLAGARNALFGHGRIHGTTETGAFDSATAAAHGHKKMAAYGTPFRKHAALPTGRDFRDVGLSALEGAKETGSKLKRLGQEARERLEPIGEAAGEGARQSLEYLKANPMAAMAATGGAGLLGIKGIAGLGKRLVRGAKAPAPGILERIGLRLATRGKA